MPSAAKESTKTILLQTRAEPSLLELCRVQLKNRRRQFFCKREQSQARLSYAECSPLYQKKKDGLILEKILKIRKIGLIRKWRRHILIHLNPHFREYRINDMFQDPRHSILKNLHRKLLFKFHSASLTHIAAQIRIGEEKENLISKS